VATPFHSDLYVLICRIEEKDSRQHMQELKVIIRYSLYISVDCGGTILS
jgi:hypothetical protein